MAGDVGTAVVVKMAVDAGKTIVKNLGNQLNFPSGGRKEAEDVKEKLEQLRSLMCEADALEDSDKEVERWGHKAREEAYNAEDILDSYKLLQPHDHNSIISVAVCRLSSSVRRRKSCYRAASELQTASEKIQGLCDQFNNLRQKFCQVERSWAGCSSWNRRRSDALLFGNTCLVGIEVRKQHLIRLLMEDSPGLRVVSLLARAGMGKTTLAKVVCDDDEVKKKFKVLKFTIPKPFRDGERELLRDMVRQLYIKLKTGDQADVDTMSLNNLKETIRDLLKDHRYLVVLDDLGDLTEWKALVHVFPNNNRGSRVLLTTQNRDVSSTTAMDSEGRVCNLEPLSEEESWLLFCRETFRRNDCPPHLKEICDRIVGVCEGLPLAIVEISRVLKTKDTDNIDEWDMFQRNLGAEIDGNEKLHDLKKMLSLSINDLPGHLKSCYLYLSNFPKHHEIEPSTVTRLWMAEGFVQPEQDKEPEGVAKEYIKQFWTRSLIQEATMTIEGRVKTFSIPQLLWEIISFKSRNQNFATIHKGQHSIGSRKVRRLSIHGTTRNLPQNRSDFHLRSLLVIGVTEEVSLGELFPHALPSMRSLHMREVTISKFPIEICDWPLIKHLSLRGTKVRWVPRSIGNLIYLETLDLKRCLVTKLPAEIEKLQHLRHLLVYRYDLVPVKFHNNFGFKTKANIGLLQFLRKIGFIEAGNGSVIPQLGKLTQLTRLGITKLRKKHGRLLCAAIDNLPGLHSLSVASTEEDEIIDLQHLSTEPKFLKRLYLRGRLDTLPHWIPFLEGLQKLSLKWSKLQDDPLPDLQHLPVLDHLQLYQAFVGENLCFRENGFENLKVLDISILETCSCIELEKGTLPVIEKIILQGCESLARIPPGIENLSSLSMLDLFEMSEEFIRTLREDDHWRIKNIPHVYLSKWVEGGIQACTVGGSLQGQDMTRTNTVTGQGTRLK